MRKYMRKTKRRRHGVRTRKRGGDNNIELIKLPLNELRKKILFDIARLNSQEYKIKADENKISTLLNISEIIERYNISNQEKYKLLRKMVKPKETNEAKKARKAAEEIERAKVKKAREVAAKEWKKWTDELKRRELLEEEKRAKEEKEKKEEQEKENFLKTFGNISNRGRRRYAVSVNENLSFIQKQLKTSND